MKLRQVGMALIVGYLVVVGATETVFASDEPLGEVVISQVQFGGAASGTATQEFVELYNNTDHPVDVTGWCVTYSSASDQTQREISCLRPIDISTLLYLDAHSYLLFVSPEYLATKGEMFVYDAEFSSTSGMSGVSGHVRVVDGQGIERDRLAWGLAVTPETEPSVAQSAGSSLVRKAVDDVVLQDTDNNANDFRVLEEPTPRSGGLYEAIIEVDVCQNIDGAQVNLPIGYEIDQVGDCYPDVCSNIGGLQISLPDGMEYDDIGGCVERDLCLNLEGAQAVIPENYIMHIDIGCVRDLPKLYINEILPNVSGTDEGNEYIEVYNPNDEQVILDDYVMRIGKTSYKYVRFPDGMTIPPWGYAVVYNTASIFTLVNTTGAIALETIDGVIVDEGTTYTDPDDDISWARFTDGWYYTNRITPGEVNLVWLDEPSEQGDTLGVNELKTCAPNQYRNPETNRCRLIDTAPETLTPCKEGQYRNTETNRCRSIVTASATLKPCAEDEFRNPATNRCKKLASMDDVALADCGEGRERNPETNRCRAVLATSTKETPYNVEPITDTAEAFVGWWALGGVGILAAGYAVWEWRHELRRAFQRKGRFDQGVK